MENQVHLFFSIGASCIYTLIQTVMEHTDPLFVVTGILDIEKVVHSINDVIIAVKMAIAELLLYVRERVVV